MKAHLTTGPVTLVDVVRLAIEAFAERPLRGDWNDELERAQAALVAEM